MIGQAIMEFNTDMSILNALGEDGHAIVDFIDAEGLASLRDLVNSKFMSVIALKYPDLLSEFKDLSLDKYHNKSSLIDHSNTWHKAMRTFDRDLIEKFIELEWVANFKNIYGDFEILGAEEIGFPDVYMRLVRPNEPSDVGPIHADRWFTELGNHKISNDYSLLKVWVPIYSETDKDGLIGISDKEIKGKSINYTAVMRDGYVKPQIDEETIKSLNFKKLKAPPGKAVCFSYDFLHGGSINKGDNSRVSIEFTLVLKDPRFKDVLNKRSEYQSSELQSELSVKEPVTRTVSVKKLEPKLLVSNYLSSNSAIYCEDINSQLSESCEPLLSILRMLNRLNILIIGSDFGLLPCILNLDYGYQAKFSIVESNRSFAETTIKNISQKNMNSSVQVMQGEAERIISHIKRMPLFDVFIVNTFKWSVINQFLDLLPPRACVLFSPDFTRAIMSIEKNNDLDGRDLESEKLLENLKKRVDIDLISASISESVIIGLKL